MDGCIRERYFEILVAVFAGAMMERAVGVIGSRDESARRCKFLIGGEAFNAIDFEVHGECGKIADSWDVQEPLNVVVGNQDRMQRFLQSKNLLRESIM